MGGGIGATLYERVREEARALGTQLYFESLPDDPLLSPNPEIRANNAKRLKFYERYGARPIVNTAYETPVTPGTADPPYLMLDPLGANDLPSAEKVKKVVRAILERKYGLLGAYVQMVVDSITDDPDPSARAALRQIEETLKGEVRASSEPRIALVLNDDHTIHHVQDRGYVEAPVRIRSIMAELDPSGLFEKIPAKRYSDRHIRAVHDGRLVDYIRKACLMAGPKKSIYPYVFPIRATGAAAARPRRCSPAITASTPSRPLSQNAYKAARAAVNVRPHRGRGDARRRRWPTPLSAPRPPRRARHLRRLLLLLQRGDRRAVPPGALGRVAILDVDYHHGNGQQDIFYERVRRPDRLDPRPPELRLSRTSPASPTRRASGQAPGFNLNLPLPEHVTPEQHRDRGGRGLAAHQAVSPPFLVVSLGFDTARGDPTGSWSNRARDFERLGQMIGEQGYPTLVVQEGGYRVRTLGANARNFFVGLVTGHSAARQMAPTLNRSAEGKPHHRNGLDWRNGVMADDVGRVRSLVASTGMFSAAEVDIAGELVTERLTKGIRSGYHFILAERGPGLAAYACYGQIEGTQGSFDLYWIAVSPEEQRKGLGAHVYDRAESAMRKAGAKHIYVDTSSSDRYAPTRGFYQQMEFVEEARLPDFYGDGDGKIIYVKSLVGARGPHRHLGESRTSESNSPN